MNQYAVADVSYIYPLLSPLGVTIFDQSRKSLNGLKVIRCINHPPERIQAMFLEDVDPAVALAGCQILTITEAEELMTTPEWSLFIPEAGEL